MLSRLRLRGFASVTEHNVSLTDVAMFSCGMCICTIRSCDKTELYVPFASFPFTYQETLPTHNSCKFHPGEDCKNVFEDTRQPKKDMLINGRDGTHVAFVCAWSEFVDLYFRF